MLDLLNKKEEMLQEISGEKIVIAGGSSVLYSFNTDEITEVYGKKVINFGVNVGLGFSYLAEYIEKHLNEGDKVILPLEFNQYTNPPYYVFGFGIDMFLKKQLFGRRKRYKQKWKLFLLSLKHAYSSASPEKMARRKQAKFGKTGCYLELDSQICEPEKKKQVPFPNAYTRTPAIEEILKFIERMEKKKVSVTVLPPAFFANKVNKSYLEDLYTEFKEYVPAGFNFELFRLEKEEVYDSVYHANTKGQKRVTNALIHLMGKELK